MRIELSTILETYERTCSIWKTGKELGIAGQTVHKRLRAAGHPIKGNRRWSEEEETELLSLIRSGVTAGDCADRLGRSFAAVTCKLNEKGISQYKTKAAQRKLKRGAGYDKASMGRHLKALETATDVSITKYAFRHGFNVDSMVYALQKYFPERWTVYKVSHYGDIKEKSCLYCQVTFIPANGKQVYCTRICADHARKDANYFGGRKREAIGFRERVCQLCLKEGIASPHAHHMVGKKHDPDNRAMVCLCPGCHSIVGKLGNMSRLRGDASAWERLINLAWLEGATKEEAQKALDEGWGIYSYVEIEFEPPDDDEG
jgi:hypothetical protein